MIDPENSNIRAHTFFSLNNRLTNGAVCSYSFRDAIPFRALMDGWMGSLLSMMQIQPSLFDGCMGALDWTISIDSTRCIFLVVNRLQHYLIYCTVGLVNTPVYDEKDAKEEREKKAGWCVYIHHLF